MIQPVLRAGAVALLAAVAAAPSGASAASADGAVYEIVRATDARVWRLNTRTGEIAVCSLDGEQLVCTSSAQAATPPVKSYAEIEAERAEQQRLADERREEKRRRSAAMLELMLSTFKTLASAGTDASGSN